MRLYQKLVLFVLAAAALPIALIGFSLLGRAEREVEARIAAQQAASADAIAREVAATVNEAVESLARAAGGIRWAELSGEERAGALRLLLSQSRHFVAAVVLDAQGEPAVPAAAVPRADGTASLSASELATFRAAIPRGALAHAAPGSVAISPAYGRTEGWAAALAVSLGAPQAGWTASVELSLAALQQRAEEVAQGELGTLWLLDAQQRVLAGPDQGGGRTLEPGERALVAAAASRPSAARLSLSGEEVLAAAARTPAPLEWTALLQLPEKRALAPVHRLRRTILGALGGGLLLLLGAGLAFTRRITSGLEQLAEGARAYGRGDLGRRVQVRGSDEVAELASVFNAMGGELAQAREKLERWNEELQREVEQRTAELRRAQAQLLEAQKLAAIGQLGAGVAHELNTPLAGILGSAQLLLLDRPEQDYEYPMLRRIEAQALRAKEITANLLRFSQQRPAPDLRPVDLNRMVRETLSLVETQISAEGVELELELAEPGPVVKGDSGHLAQVLLHLVANARAAMLKSATRRLTVATFQGDGVAGFEVRDTGRGIPEKDLPHLFEPFFTTKDVWSNVGLGLSVSFRIVSEHGGRIHVQTEVGEGSRFTVELPAAEASRAREQGVGG